MFRKISVSETEYWSKFPGDELIHSPEMIITHSITIHALSEMVWPWLVQLGSGRAGWYSYDRIDNGGNPSSKIIIPELQHIKVGDIFPATPDSIDAFIVQQVLPGKAIVLVATIQSAAGEPDTLKRMAGPLRLSWTLALENLDYGSTRLISRGRISSDWLTTTIIDSSPTTKPILIERIYGLLARMPWKIMQPIAMTGHSIMESHMLKGIKSRSEIKNHCH